MGTPTRCISDSQSEAIILQKTPLILRNVIFLAIRSSLKEASFPTSIINQSLYHMLTYQNSKLVRYYRASHAFSAARETQLKQKG